MSSIPLFDGDHKPKRNVSLGGASRQSESASNLLLKVHQQREARELVRKRNQAALKLQSFVRGAIIRKRIYRQLRSTFDQSINKCSDHTLLIELTSSHLLVFYNERKDHSRLVLVCQKWIQLKVPILNELSSLTSSVHHILFRLLVLCLSSLRGNPHQALAPPLRLLEVFTFNQPHTPTLLEKLIKQKYLYTFRFLLETRVPPPDGEGCGLVPLSSEILKFIERSINENSISYIFNELLSSSLSPHLFYLILPLLARPHPFLPLLMATALKEVRESRLIASPTLCFCLMELNKWNFGSVEVLMDSFSLLSKMLEVYQFNNINKERIIMEDEEMEEIVEQDMDTDPLSGSDQSIVNSILIEINKGSFINPLLPIKKDISPDILKGLCSISYHVIMNTPAVHLRYHSHLLSSLSLSSHFLRQIWQYVTSLSLERSFGPPIKCLDYLSHGMRLPASVGVVILEQMTVFSCLFSISLSSLHDTEVASKGPFSLKELASVSLILKDLFIVLHLENHLDKTRLASDSRPRPFEWTFLANLLCSLLKELHSRDVRLGFLTPDRWASVSLPSKVPPELFLFNEEDEESSKIKNTTSPTTLKYAELLKRAPYVFPFVERFIFLHKLIKNSRQSAQGFLQDFLMGPSISIAARRTHLYEDAFSKLSGRDLRYRILVTLINAQGLEEAGIDGGGLFREFLSETIKTGYNPNRGFFISSDSATLYPNPLAHLISDEYPSHYQFLGGLLGKALLENMLIELPLASFFLRKLTTPGRGWVETHYLSSLDPELYRQLLSLKDHRESDFDQLGLDFTTLSNEFGQIKLVELKPGGSDIPVTYSNRIEYIHLLSQYHLNQRMESQFQSFRKGLNEVVPVLWLTLFNEQELQVLISGAVTSIDVNDLYNHTTYSGEYSKDHATIKLFWDVVREFSEKQKQGLIKFVTSCSRAPLLGFSELQPPFTILSARETDHLPSASTCMHLLKLPLFDNKETLRDKLLYALSSGSGFELS